MSIKNYQKNVYKTVHIVTTCFIIHPKPFSLHTLTSHDGITTQNCSLHDQSRNIHYSYTIVYLQSKECVVYVYVFVCLFVLEGT
jgi:hypothetical protein